MMSKEVGLKAIDFVIKNSGKRKNIEIETDIAESVLVSADAELLSLVWNNLLSNAFKFTPAGGTVTVELRIHANHILITGDSDVTTDVKLTNYHSEKTAQEFSYPAQSLELAAIQWEETY